MLLIQGVLFMRQAEKLNEAEKHVETNVLPSVKLLGSLDREFVSLRGNNARLRNPLEPQERKTKAISDIQQSRQMIGEYSDSLAKLLVTAEGRQAFGELKQAITSYNAIQDRYLSETAAGNLEAAVKTSNTDMKAAAVSDR